MDFLINAANVLYICAYFVRDLLVLRCLTLVAATCLIGYFYLRPEPLMAPVYWNLFFITVNVFWVVRLLRERLAAA